ncbi:MAG: glycosyltransferase family 39 protein [Chloroflexi bacterium]|nr:glycosyltransferase family 39 protein [Chloroflexota bacterium]
MNALTTAPAAEIQRDQPPTPRRFTSGYWPGPHVDLMLALGIGLVALAVRWPYLWIVPRFTDETLEVLHSLAIVREGARPLTNYDSYYGALYNYAVALALWLGGESPRAPRVVVLLAGAATVVVTYGLGRELGRRLLPLVRGGRATDTGAILPRLVGSIAAGLLAVNGPHVVVNSHVAWSNCLTPLFTTLAAWALLRATRRPSVEAETCEMQVQADAMAARAPSAAWSTKAVDVRAKARDRTSGLMLAATGLLLGLALQTHPLVAVLLPAAALVVVVQGRRFLLTPWPWIAAALFLVGYANVLAYNADHGFESLRSAQRMRGEYAQDEQATTGYVPTFGSMVLLLARILGGAVDQRDGVAGYLLDPSVIAVTALAAVGVALLARRGEPLPLVFGLTFLLLLPALNPKFRTLITSRYLMPLVPLLFASAAVGLVWFGSVLAALLPAVRRRWLSVALAGLAVMLSTAPLASLGRYYARSFERADTNERILRLSAEIQAARQPAEAVLVDEAIGSELPDTGVTELRGFEHLLIFGRVPYRVVRPSPGRLQDELGDDRSVLIVMNARDAAAADARLTVIPLDPRPPATSGRMSDYRLYRLEAKRA